jgi:hypothetical protein
MLSEAGFAMLSLANLIYNHEGYSALIIAATHLSHHTVIEAIHSRTL